MQRDVNLLLYRLGPVLSSGTRDGVRVSERAARMPHFKSEKLRVNLRLAINRLKLLEKKKSALVSVFFRVCSCVSVIIGARERVYLFGSNVVQSVG